MLCVAAFSCLFPSKQTIDGKAPGGYCAAEMKAILLEILDVCKQKGMTKVILSLDNDRGHTSAMNALVNCGVLTAQQAKDMRAPHPSHSPDMHKAVEHVHGTLTTFMQRLMEQTPDSMGHDAKWYMEQLQKYFYDHIKADDIAKDVASLKLTHEEIVRLQGGWPGRGYR